MTIYKCDKCDKHIQSALDLWKVEASKPLDIHSGITREVIGDLCPKCKESIFKFMNPPKSG